LALNDLFLFFFINDTISSKHGSLTTRVTIESNSMKISNYSIPVALISQLVIFHRRNMTAVLLKTEVVRFTIAFISMKIPCVTRLGRIESCETAHLFYFL